MRYTRIHAARQVGRSLLFQENCLASQTKISAADVIGLLLAAALVAVNASMHPKSLADAAHLAIALGITASFALVAWVARGVNWSGMIAGAAIAFLFAARNLRMFWILLLVFGITLAATRTGKTRKQELRTAEKSGGRTAAQVMANLGVAGLILAIGPAGWETFALAALAEATADTSSSEIGMAYPGKTILLTSWKGVAPGVDGGVSIKGTIAALFAAGMISAAAVLMKLVPPSHGFAIMYAGVLGSLADSVLGALLERRGLLTNDLVNFLSTAVAVVFVRAFI